MGPEPVPATPSLPKPTTPPPAPPAPASSEKCTARTANTVWNHMRCQERCGNLDDCGSSQVTCARFCSFDCPCGATEEDEEDEDEDESCTASTDNTHWNDARCQERCGNADECSSA